MPTPTDFLDQGQHALASAEWDTARESFERALEQQPSPEAHDGLGLALWWLNDIRASHHQRTLAFQQFKKSGDTKRAAMIAMWLAREQVFLSGNVNAMKGWFARAERLLADEPRGVEHAWFQLLRASLLASPQDLENIAQETLGDAHAFHEDDLETMALAFSGIARVTLGHVEQGMADLDEAMTAALGGGVNLTTVSETFCLLLSACDIAGDLGRTEQWCRTAREYAEQNHFPFLAATCRETYGGLLTALGRWNDAEQELSEAIRAFEQGHYALRVQAVIKLADLRVWQGRLEEAEALLAGLEDLGASTLPMARLAYTRGDYTSARAILTQALDSANGLTLDQAPLLRLLVDVSLATNDIDAATLRVAQLEELANASNSEVLRANADLARGQILRAQRNADAAHYFSSALYRLNAFDQSLLAARARFEMAQLTRDNDRAAALTWARAALASFERLGAKQDAARVSEFLRSIGAPPRAVTRSTADLTIREREVLNLLAHGLSNREIAERLVVSPKTVEHHVTQILSKLGARSRAEAAAFAARMDL